MQTLSRLAKSGNIIALLLLFFFANLVLIPAVYPKFQTLDLLPSYTPAEAYRLIDSYGAQGRQQYAIVELTLDLAYPLLLGLLFSLLALVTFQRAFPAPSWTHRLALLPFLVMLADYLENACVTILLMAFPRDLPTVAALANIFTVTKQVLTPLELVFIVGLVVWLIKSRKPRATPATPA